MTDTDNARKLIEAARADMCLNRSTSRATAWKLAAALQAALDDVERLQPLIDAAHGLSFGEDWNKGNAAIRHGYRRKLLVAIGRIKGKDASPQAEAAANRAALQEKPHD